MSTSLTNCQEVEAKLLTEIFKAQGKEVLPRETYWFEDPTVIMPGTKFIETISGALEYYIRCRISIDPWWKDIKVWLCLWVFSSTLFTPQH
jgi:5'-3' exoribonuclease 2